MSVSLMNQVKWSFLNLFKTIFKQNISKSNSIFLIFFEAQHKTTI